MAGQTPPQLTKVLHLSQDKLHVAFTHPIQLLLHLWLRIPVILSREAFLRPALPPLTSKILEYGRCLGCGLRDYAGYINQNVISKLIDKAALIDESGASEWGQSGEIHLSPQEMAGITGAFKDPSSAQANGIHVGGIKYIYNKTEEVDKVPILHAAKGKEGVIAAKCSRSILVAHSPESAPIGSAISFIQVQAKHLIANGC
ncbi:Profilin [Elaphomyces granulatus]